MDLTGSRFTHHATAVFAPQRGDLAWPVGRPPSSDDRERRHFGSFSYVFAYDPAVPSVLQGIIIRHMNDLSKDAVNWLAVGADGEG